jgi:hypothetical protein
MNEQPTHGQEVQIAESAPTQDRPGARAWIVGIREDPSNRSSWLAIVEFEDGSSVELSVDVLDSAS